jgi:hypothetical protein
MSKKDSPRCDLCRFWEYEGASEVFGSVGGVGWRYRVGKCTNQDSAWMGREPAEWSHCYSFQKKGEKA